MNNKGSCLTFNSLINLFPKMNDVLHRGFSVRHFYLGSLKRPNEGVWRRKKGDTVLLCFRNTMLFVVVIKPKVKHCVPGHPSSGSSQGLLCALMPAV